MTAAKVLRIARALLAHESRWLHGADAASTDADGNRVLENDPRAIRWTAAAAPFATGAPKQLAREAVHVLFMVEPDLIEWNDAADRTHADVLRLYDHAIELATRIAGGPESGAWNRQAERRDRLLRGFLKGVVRVERGLLFVDGEKGGWIADLFDDGDVADPIDSAVRKALKEDGS